LGGILGGQRRSAVRAPDQGKGGKKRKGGGTESLLKGNKKGGKKRIKQEACCMGKGKRRGICPQNETVLIPETFLKNRQKTVTKPAQPQSNVEGGEVHLKKH